MKFKIIFLIWGIMLNYSMMANEQLQIKWIGYASFKLGATEGKLFTVDWGDGSDIETYTGRGNWPLIALAHNYVNSIEYTVTISGKSEDCFFTYLEVYKVWHEVITLPVTQIILDESPSLWAIDIRDCPQLDSIKLSPNENIALEYFDCYNANLKELDLSPYLNLKSGSFDQNQLTSLVLDNKTKLETLTCAMNQLTSLDLSDCPALSYISCYNNYLPLSELFLASERINDPEKKLLGSQIVPSQIVVVGEEIDFSSQVEFKDIATVFDIKKGDATAELEHDYTINNGIITFIKDGVYTVTMTNEAIVSRPDYPAKVVVEFEVGYDGIIDTTEISDILYPNPTSGMVYISTEKEYNQELNLYSLEGKLLQSLQTMEIDMSNYPVGIYFIQINGKTMKIIKN